MNQLQATKEVRSQINVEGLCAQQVFMFALAIRLIKRKRAANQTKDTEANRNVANKDPLLARFVSLQNTQLQPKHQALILVDSLFWNYFHNKDLGKEWLKRFLQASTQIAGKEYSEVCEELVKKLTFACLQETADKFDYRISAMHVLFALFASSSVQDIGVFHEELYLLLQECRLTVNDWIAFQKDMLLLVFRVIREILQQHQKQNIPLISGETESLLFEKLSKMCLVVRDGAVALLELCKQHDLQQGFHNANTTSQAVGRQLQQYVTTDLQQWILSQLAELLVQSSHLPMLPIALHCVAEDIEFGIEHQKI